MQSRQIDLTINKMTKAQFNNITPNPDEVYLITDDNGLTQSDIITALGYTPANANSIGNATITITQGGVSKGTFTTNQTSNATIALDAGGGTGGIQNTATGTDSLTILGTATTNDFSMNIGLYSSVTEDDSIAIGQGATVSGYDSLGIGRDVDVSGDNSIQLGYGTLISDNTFQVWNYPLLDYQYGLIPDARISTNIARTSQIPSAVTESTVSGWGFTKNTGTVTSVNNVSPVRGNVTLSIPTATSDLTNDSGFITSIPTATSSSLGIVQPDNTTITIDSNGVISSNVASRNVGEVITSTLPLTDAGLHLLDGSLIQGGGMYQGFVDYIAELYNDTKVYNPSAFAVVGSPTITDDGIASGFSTSDYLTGSHSNITPTSSIELNCRITLNSMPNTTERIWSSRNDANFFLAARNDGSLHFRIKEEAFDTGVSLASGGFVFGEYVDLYARVTTTNLYFKTTTQQGFTQERNITVSNPFTALSSFRFGIGGTYIGNSFTTGSIDLKQFSITVDGVEVFSGSNPANYFTDETTWQNSVTQYGSCGKFVYDSVSNTVRLPKISGILEGTTDIAESGDLVQAGLPNITGWARFRNMTEKISSGGALSNSYAVSGNSGYGDSLRGDSNIQIDFNASTSNSIYGRSSTVQPQTSKVLYYIVVATSAKIDVQVDIDNIAADLNNKADTDFSNVSTNGTSLGAGWAMPSNKSTNLSLGSSGSQYTAPANGWLKLTLSLNAKGYIGIGGVFTQNGEANGAYNSVLFPLRKDQTVTITYAQRASTIEFEFVYAQGSESEAS